MADRSVLPSGRATYGAAAGDRGRLTRRAETGGGASSRRRDETPPLCPLHHECDGRSAGNQALPDGAARRLRSIAVTPKAPASNAAEAGSGTATSVATPDTNS